MKLSLIMVVGLSVVPRSPSDPMGFSGSGCLDPTPGFSFLKLLKHDELSIKAMKWARIFLHFSHERNKDVPALLHNLQSFHLTFYEQTVSRRSKRPTSCYQHLKIVPESESCWKKKKKPAPDYSLFKYCFRFVSAYSETKEKWWVCMWGNEGGSAGLHSSKNITQFPSTLSTSFKTLSLVIVPVHARKSPSI